MSSNKRIKGNYLVESVDGNDTITIKSQTIRLQGLDRFTDEPDTDGVPNVVNTIVIDGNLQVTGNTDTISTTNTEIVDNFVTLNSGETSPTGISNPIPNFDGAASSGFIIERGGTVSDVGLRYNDDTNQWEATDDGTTWYALSGADIVFDIVDDTTPQLGGNLDVNGFSIVSVSNGDIVLSPDGTGEIVFEQNLKLLEQATDETPEAGYNKVYAKTASGDGGSGLFFATDTEQGELVSARKAKIYGILF